MNSQSGEEFVDKGIDVQLMGSIKLKPMAMMDSMPSFYGRFLWEPYAIIFNRVPFPVCPDGYNLDTQRYSWVGRPHTLNTEPKNGIHSWAQPVPICDSGQTRWPKEEHKTRGSSLPILLTALWYFLRDTGAP